MIDTFLACVLLRDRNIQTRSGVYWDKSWTAAEEASGSIFAVAIVWFYKVDWIDGQSVLSISSFAFKVYSTTCTIVSILLSSVSPTQQGIKVLLISIFFQHTCFLFVCSCILLFRFGMDIVYLPRGLPFHSILLRVQSGHVTAWNAELSKAYHHHNDLLRSFESQATIIMTPWSPLFIYWYFLYWIGWMGFGQRVKRTM